MAYPCRSGIELTGTNFMKTTNIHNLPEAIVKAICNDSYTGPKNESNHISVTTLINPPKIHFLKCRHWDEIIEDASDRLWSLLGQAVHSVLERGESKNTITEERITEEIDGFKISGQIDIMGNESIEDYKCTSTWSYLFEPTGKPEWIAQLNIYAYLARKIITAKRLMVHLILRDHISRKAKQDPTYPQIPFKSIDLPLWTQAETKAYIQGRISLFRHCKDLPDEKLPDCTAAEMWENKGKRNRCDSYCSVNKWCSQYKAYKGE